MKNKQLDITKMLHQAIDLELTADDALDLMIGPEARLQTIYVQLDLKISAFAKVAGWADVLHPRHDPDYKQLKSLYVQSLALFLLASAKRQWTHLVVLTDEQWQRITTADKKDKLADLNKEYLAVQNFLNSAYFNRRHEDFRHAWHLWLKMGIIDFDISSEEIAASYQAMVDKFNQQFE
jgi:hypothetical protein